MRCPQCGAEWAPGTRFCGNCGADLTPKVCPRCQAEVDPTKRFCTSCGASLDPTAAADRGVATSVGEASTTVGRERGKEQAPQERAKPKGKGRGCGCLGGGCLTTLLLILLIIGGGIGAAAYYFFAPDLPPLSSYLPSWDDLRDQIPFLRPSVAPPLPLSPAEQRQMEEIQAQREAQRQAQRQREERVRTQLQATGLPVSGVYILETGQGEPVLTVAVDYEKLIRGLSASAGLAEGVDALIRIVNTKALDLSGLAYTTVAVRDEQGRTLFGVTAATKDIERFRAGQMTRKDFIRATAARAESRAGVVEALRKLAQ